MLFFSPTTLAKREGEKRESMVVLLSFLCPFFLFPFFLLSSVTFDTLNYALRTSFFPLSPSLRVLWQKERRSQSKNGTWNKERGNKNLSLDRFDTRESWRCCVRESRENSNVTSTQPRGKKWLFPSSCWIFKVCWWWCMCMILEVVVVVVLCWSCC